MYESRQAHQGLNLIHFTRLYVDDCIIIQSEEIINQRAKSAKADLQPLSNKHPDEALGVIQYRLIDLNKKLDMLVYQQHKV